MAVKRISALVVVSCLAAACATLPRLSAASSTPRVERANASACDVRCMGQQGYGVAASSSEEQAAFKGLKSKAEQRAWMAERMTGEASI